MYTATKLTRKMMSALQNLGVFAELLLGPCDEVIPVITGRLGKGEKQILRVLRGKASLECSCLVFDWLLNLHAEATGFLSTQFRRIVQSIQTSTRRFVSPIESGLGFRIDDAHGNWVEMGSHAVYTEAKQCEIPAAPSECTVEMPLYFEFTIVRTRQVV